jgi:hypothetical protein
VTDRLSPCAEVERLRCFPSEEQAGVTSCHAFQRLTKWLDQERASP